MYARVNGNSIQKIRQKVLKQFFYQIIGGGAWPLLARGWLRPCHLLKDCKIERKANVSNNALLIDDNYDSVYEIKFSLVNPYGEYVEQYGFVDIGCPDLLKLLKIR